MNGSGIERDLGAAFALCEQAAEAGDPDAQHMLGVMYKRGDGVAANLDRAMHWWRAAGMHGHEAALAQLARFEDDGEPRRGWWGHSILQGAGGVIGSVVAAVGIWGSFEIMSDGGSVRRYVFGAIGGFALAVIWILARRSR